MAANFGRITRDLMGCTLYIGAKLVLDKDANLNVANAVVSHLTVEDELYVGNIVEEEFQQGITITGDVMLNEGYSLTADEIIANVITTNQFAANSDQDLVFSSNVCVEAGKKLFVYEIEEKLPDRGVIIKKEYTKYPFGMGRAYAPDETEVSDVTPALVEFPEKSYESTFTTSTGIIHANANTQVTFQAPSLADVGFEYGNLLVRVDASIATKAASSNIGDMLVFTLVKNKTDDVSRVRHTYTSNLTQGLYSSFNLHDVVKVAPEDTLDVFAVANNASGDLAANILGGELDTYITFEIEGFE